MLSMGQMDMAENILDVMNDLDNYPDHAPADVLPESDDAYTVTAGFDDDYEDQAIASPAWRFTDDGILQTIDDATGEWAHAGSLDDDVWAYRKNQPGI